tara:strand:- start:9084 stop:9233 length:150 start_codon:yes stop_codon:yes gene_type:complete
MCGRTVSFGPLGPQVQPFLAINPVNTLMVVHETLTSQKDVDPPKTISDP